MVSRYVPSEGPVSSASQGSSSPEPDRTGTEIKQTINNGTRTIRKLNLEPLMSIASIYKPLNLKVIDRAESAQNAYLAILKVKNLINLSSNILDVADSAPKPEDLAGEYSPPYIECTLPTILYAGPAMNTR
jgi:hypothetical protein